MYILVGPAVAKHINFTNNLDLGGITCQQEAFIGPDNTHKTVTAGIENVVLDGTSKVFSKAINTPAAEGIFKIFVQITYQSQLLLEYVGINGVLVMTGTITDPGLS